MHTAFRNVTKMYLFIKLRLNHHINKDSRQFLPRADIINIRLSVLLTKTFIRQLRDKRITQEICRLLKRVKDKKEIYNRASSANFHTVSESYLALSETICPVL